MLVTVWFCNLVWWEEKAAYKLVLWCSRFGLVMCGEVREKGNVSLLVLWFRGAAHGLVW